MQADDTPRPLLVDVKESYLDGSAFISSSSRTQEELIQPNNNAILHNILWFNLPSWINLDRINFYIKNCSYTNCQHTKDRNLIKQSNAVIFCITEGGLKSASPPLSPLERPSGQVWIFFGLESPAMQKAMYNGLIPSWKNSMNWSMSYRLDADIVVPYGFLKTRREIPERNYSEIFRRKTKWAAWVVSKCSPPSLRGRFVDKLKQYGLPIDIYGRCGMSLTTDPKEMISNDYRFYLSFENSMCSDYVTEKFFRYFPLDTILLVRGGADYKKLVPQNTYIDTADFDTFSELVEHLKYVGSNEKLYTEYLRRKDVYSSYGEIIDNDISYCSLCRKLNNVDKHRKTYDSIPRYQKECYVPNDLEEMDAK